MFNPITIRFHFSCLKDGSENKPARLINLLEGVGEGYKKPIGTWFNHDLNRVWAGYYTVTVTITSRTAWPIIAKKLQDTDLGCTIEFLYS